MTPEQKKLRDTILPVLSPYTQRISVYGSFARGEMGTDSDIDLLLSLKSPDDRPPLGLRWFQLEDELAELLGRPVEMVTEEALDVHLQPFIEQDLIVLYEKG